MTGNFSEKEVLNFSYSKKSHFGLFKRNGVDIQLLGKQIDIENEADFNLYQDLLLYTFLKSTQGLKVLQIEKGSKLKTFKSLNNVHECWKMSSDDLLKDPSEYNILKIPSAIKQKKSPAKYLQALYDILRIPSDSSKDKLKDPAKYFDFIHIPSLNSLPNDRAFNQKILESLKNMLSKDGVILGNFLIVIDDKVWAEELFYTFAHDRRTMNRLTSFYKIYNDSDLFVLPENVYNNHWKDKAQKSYKEYGKVFCCNLFLDNRGKIFQDDFDDYGYLKESHYDFFKVNGYTEELFNGQPGGEKSLNGYKSLMIYTFIKSNLKKGERVLQIGNAPGYLEELLKAEYDLYKIDEENLTGNYLHFERSISHLSSDNTSGLYYKDFFDFSYSVSWSEDSLKKYYIFVNVTNNIHYVMRVGSHTFFCFDTYIKEDKFIYNRMQKFLLNDNMFKITRPGKSFPGKDLYTVEENHQSNENRGIKDNFKKSVYNVLCRKISYLPASTSTRADNRLKKHPAYIFHHLIKCGGTSVFFILDNWFKTADDNIFFEDLNTYVIKKFNSNLFHNDFCLRAHFQRDGAYLHQRYPELLEREEEYRIFTFIRNPLSIKISKYYFLKSLSYVNKDVRLEDNLMSGKNFVASLFPCNESNYKQVLDRYFFTGIVENLQESFDILAELIGKKKIKVPYLNTSQKDEQIKGLSSSFIHKFEKYNELDYKIYEYCLEKFRIQKNNILKK